MVGLKWKKKTKEISFCYFPFYSMKIFHAVSKLKSLKTRKIIKKERNEKKERKKTGMPVKH